MMLKRISELLKKSLADDHCFQLHILDEDMQDR
jgi:hypothetical protein